MSLAPSPAARELLRARCVKSLRARPGKRIFEVPEALKPVLKLLWLSLVAVLAYGFSELAGPGPATAQNAPPSYASAEQTIHGRIRSVAGPFRITVLDDKGYLDNVALHHGTIINPTGLTLAPGMSVTILGYNAGSVFEANEIDTPYTYAGPPPAAVYYGPGWWYPGFVYGYGPSYALILHGGHAVHHPFPHPRPWSGPAPEPHPYAGHPYVGRHP